MNREGASHALFIPGVLLAVAVALCGWWVSESVVDFKRLNRHVTVKGLAEREVRADLAMWPISFTVAADELAELHAELRASREAIKGYLTEQGFDGEAVSHAAPEITDTSTRGYPPGNEPPHRYRAKQVVLVRSGDITRVKQAMSQSGDLVAKGVVLAQDYQHRPRFEFTSLNDIKPDMIRTATENAREAARQFAEDSGSKVGAIRNARQGIFTIRDRDPYTPEIKVVRVVSTIDYYLEE
ncbi:SIMPL domain-containing protein [Desulfohalovibrio reitneri]|uniref:SIMPL domain-containing protein n=1 Tax=Desulfohalovibrio reitneri TaxID=1307759 RepID=UPI0004A6B9E2|nr:SIMPL domain-containing protein [Desulfohalovibrio reitneri]